MALLPRCLHAKEDGHRFHEEALRDLHSGGVVIDGCLIRMAEYLSAPKIGISFLLKTPIFNA